MDITPAKVMGLRQKTSLPMMECKKALEEAGGDEARAIELLRKKGLAQVGKRSGNVTGQGRIVVHVDPKSKRAAIAELLCETEPVTNTDDFLGLARTAVRIAAETGLTDAQQVLDQADRPGHKFRESFDDVLNKIRENIKIGRVATAQGDFGYYIHHDGRKGVLVEFSGPVPDQLKADVCMHIVALRPVCTRREEVDPALVESERRIAREQVKDKPPQITDKIVEGKINKWYSEIVLLEQFFVKDDKQTVQQVLKQVSPGLTINRFTRIEIGEGQ